jgi:drug/metabolite transporter (DMT)-like permease
MLGWLTHVKLPPVFGAAYWIDQACDLGLTRPLTSVGLVLAAPGPDRFDARTFRRFDRKGAGVAVVLALFSSILWGSADFYGGLLSRRLSAYAVVGGSQAFGLLAVTIAALATGGFAEPTGWIGWSVLAGVSGSLGLVCFYAALASGTMGVVSPIAALGAVVPVAAGLARGEQPSAVAVVGIVVGLAGAVAASGPELGSAVGGRSVLLAALAGVCFGAALTFLAFGAEDSAVMTLWGMRVTSVAAFLAAAIVAGSMGGLRAADAPALVAVGLADAGANLLFSLATQRGLISLVSVVGSLYPVATVLLAYVILHERLQRIQVVGTVAALCGVALVSLG